MQNAGPELGVYSGNALYTQVEFAGDSGEEMILNQTVLMPHSRNWRPSCSQAVPGPCDAKITTVLAFRSALQDCA